MTKIEYIPHCANCGALINEEIVYREDKVEVTNNAYIRNLYLNSIKILPYRCSNCGEIFNKIEIKQPRKIINEGQI
jgi:DNA-directed RNA polymerase subunit RPC12/RpoP